MMIPRTALSFPCFMMTLDDDWTDPIIRVFRLHVQHIDDLRADTPLGVAMIVRGR